jgi:multidrug efflux pump subunit AcrB
MKKHRINILYQAPELSPEKVEAKIVVPVEKTIETLRGVEQINSTAMNGRAEIEVVLSSLETEDEILRSIKDMLDKKQRKLTQDLGATLVVGAANSCAK